MLKLIIEVIIGIMWVVAGAYMAKNNKNGKSSASNKSNKNVQTIFSMMMRKITTISLRMKEIVL